MTMEQRLEVVAAAGYTGGEMVAEWMKWDDAEKKRVIAKKNALHVTFDAMFPSLTPLNDPAMRAQLKDDVAKAIPVAKELGCPMFLMKSGPRIASQSPEEQKRQIADGLKVVAEQSSAAGMELLLEPIDLLESKTIAVSSVAEAFEITRAVGDPKVKVLYDLYHEQRGSGNLIEKLEKNIDQVGLVHIADVPGRHKPGTGEIDYANVYRALARLKYDRYIAMEFYAASEAENVAELKAAKAEVVAVMAGA